MGPICRQHGKLGDTVAGKFDSLASEIDRLPSPLPSDFVPPKPSPPYAARYGHLSLASVGFLKSTEIVLILSTYSIHLLEAYEDDSVQSGRGYSTLTMWTFLMTRTPPRYITNEHVITLGTSRHPPVTGYRLLVTEIVFMIEMGIAISVNYIR